MKKSTSFSERIKNYSLFSSAIFASSIAADAQVIYTDVAPDYEGISYQPFYLDLNNDGITDFTIDYLYDGSGYWYSYTAVVNVAPGNEVANSYGGIKVCDFGDNITSNLTWNSASLQMLANRWRDGTQILWFLTDFGFKGNWLEENEKYMALRFTSGGEQYYGWVRLSVLLGHEVGYIIHDYAYYSVPETPVIAGCLEDTLTVFLDSDGDGYGDAAISGTATNCAVLNGFVYDSTDCNDTDASVNPGATEVNNGVDDECNGIVDADFWTAKTDFGGTIRHSATGFSIGSKGYMGMGVYRNNEFDEIEYKDFWEYNPAANTWTQKADFPGAARQDAIGFSIGNKGYVGTGYTFYNIVYKDFWEYNPGNNTWNQRADFGGAARFGAVGFSIGNKGYIGTGSSGFPPGYYNDFWEYDPATDTWTQKADFGGTPRSSAVGFSIGGKGYIGTSGDPGNDFWEYNPANNSWNQKADFAGEARSSATGFSIGNKGYIGAGNASSGFKNDFWEYDVETDTWTKKTDFSGIERPEAAGFSIGSKGYIGTGGTHGGSYDFFYFYKDFWEYTPQCDSIIVYADADGDGYGNANNSLSSVDCLAVPGFVYNNTDCDDNNALVNPVAPEICDDLDNNCDGNIDPLHTFYADADSDGFGNIDNTIIDCIAPAGYVADSADCDDNNALVNPTAIEICDGMDNNCDGTIDEGVLLIYYADDDGDLYGNTNDSAFACTLPNGYVTDNTDCDDNNALVNPASIEICNNIDDNCNTFIDDGLIPDTYFEDSDNDGFGDPNSPIDSCAQPTGFITDSTDCDDSNANINPGAPEILFNGIDDDCDGYVDEFGTDIYSSANTASVFSLFPNPTNGEFVVYLQINNELNTEAKIEVINLLGQVVYNKESALAKGKLEEAIKLNDAADGIYLVKVMVNDEMYCSQIVHRKK